MEQLLEAIADSVGMLVVNLAELKAGLSKFTINIDGVRSLKEAIDGTVSAVSETRDSNALLHAAEEVSALEDASKLLTDAAANLLRSSIEAKKTPSELRHVDSSLESAKKILSSLVNLVLIEDRVNLATLSWFAKEVALSVRDMNQVTNGEEFAYVAEMATKQLAIFADFATTKLNGDKYPSQKDRLKVAVVYVTKSGPQKYWTAVTDYLNFPEDEEKRLLKLEECDKMCEVIDEITELIREMYEANQAFIDQAFRRPPPHTLRKQDILDGLRKMENALRNQQKNGDEVNQVVQAVLKNIGPEKFKGGRRTLTEDAHRDFQEALKQHLRNLRSIPKEDRDKIRSTDPDAQGRQAILNALNGLRHILAPAEELLAHSRNDVVDALDRVSPGQSSPEAIQLGQRHQKILDHLLDTAPLHANRPIWDVAKNDVKAAIEELRQNPSSLHAQDKLRRAVNVGVRPDDVVRARQADVKWGLDNLRKVANEKKSPEEIDASMQAVKDYIRRHIDAARAARAALGAGDKKDFDDAETEYMRMYKKLVGDGMNMWKDPYEAHAKIFEQSAGDVDHAAQKLTNSALSPALENHSTSSPSTWHPTNTARKIALDDVNATQFAVRQHLGALKRELHSNKGEVTDPAVAEGERVLAAIKRHIAAVRAARNAAPEMEPKATALDDAGLKLKRHLDSTRGGDMGDVSPLIEAVEVATTELSSLARPTTRPANDVTIINDLLRTAGDEASHAARDINEFLDKDEARNRAIQAAQRSVDAIDDLISAGETAMKYFDSTTPNERRDEVSKCIRDLDDLRKGICSQVDEIAARPADDPYFPNTVPFLPPQLMKAVSPLAAVVSAAKEAFTIQSTDKVRDSITDAQIVNANDKVTAAENDAMTAADLLRHLLEGSNLLRDSINTARVARQAIQQVKEAAQASQTVITSRQRSESIEKKLTKIDQLIADMDRILSLLFANPNDPEALAALQEVAASAPDLIEALVETALIKASDAVASGAAGTGKSPLSQIAGLVPEALSAATDLLECSPDEDNLVTYLNLSGKALDRFNALQEAARAARDIFADEERRAEIDRVLAAFSNELPKLDNAVKQVLKDRNDKNVRAVNSSIKKLRELAKDVVTTTTVRPTDLISPLWSRAVRETEPARGATSLLPDVADNTSKILEYIDEDGNLVTFLSLTGNALNRYKAFEEAAQSARDQFADSSRRQEIDAALETLSSAIPKFEQATHELERASANDRAEAFKKVKLASREVEQSAFNVASAITVKPEDVLRTAEEVAEAEPQSPRRVPRPSRRQLPPVPLVKYVVLNPSADPRFFNVAKQLQARVAQQVTPTTVTMLDKVTKVSQQIAVKIADIGASIKAKDARSVVDHAKLLAVTMKAIQPAAIDFLSVCKDERLRQQFSIEVQAIENMSMQLKILSAVCAGGTDEDSTQRLVSLTQKISEATVRAMQAAELCALSGRRFSTLSAQQ